MGRKDKDIDIDDTDETPEPQDQQEQAAQGGEVIEDAPPTGNDLERLTAERNMLFERLARAQADFQNSRKRLEAESEQRLQYANASLIKSLLPVIDNFERALAQDPAKVDAAAILKGMQIVHDQWLAVLKKESVEEIAPTVGTPFDPTRHEALLQQSSDQYKEPTVTQLFQKGYSLHDRTLRPAQVAVSKTAG